MHTLYTTQRYRLVFLVVHGWGRVWSINANEGLACNATALARLDAVLVAVGEVERVALLGVHQLKVVLQAPRPALGVHSNVHRDGVVVRGRGNGERMPLILGEERACHVQVHALCVLKVLLVLGEELHLHDTEGGSTAREGGSV